MIKLTVGDLLLRNICATISPHLVTAIMGPSGAGKLSQVYVSLDDHDDDDNDDDDDHFHREVYSTIAIERSRRLCDDNRYCIA